MAELLPDTDAPPPADEARRALSPWTILLLVLLAAAVLSGWGAAIVAVLGLALLIFVHELGHFTFAKLFGMRVERFYIGFPPAALTRRRGETEYGVGIIPLGGFCKISGMNPEEEIPDEVRERAYYAKPIWQRNLTILAGPLFNIGAAVVILFALLMVGGEARTTLTVDYVQPGTPAAAAGLHAGDTLVGVDGGRLASWDEAVSFFRDHPHDQVTLTWRTGAGVECTATVTLTTNPTDPNSQAGYLGVRSRVVTVRPAPWTGLWMAVRWTGDIVYRTFQGLWLLVSGQTPVGGSEGAVGPVGIVKLSLSLWNQDPRLYVLLLAFLAVNLGIINLLPLLPFDGGHLVLNTIERVRGRRVPARVVERFVVVGVALLLTFTVYVTWFDIRGR